jgi:hypothetical protein
MGAVKELLAEAEENGQTEAQARALFAICERYKVTYRPGDYRPALPKGWVEGWVGGYDAAKLYIGCDPDGRIHS